MAIESIAKTLGTGSGIDITSLVNQLVDAQFEAKQVSFTKREETLTAQISAASELKSSISQFDSALKSLIYGGTLAAQPTSSNAGLLKVSALPGANVTGTSATVEVRQLAQAQVASSALIADKTAPVGTGSLRLTLGTATVANGAMTGFAAGSATPVDIEITAADNSLDKIAARINAAKAGVSASVLSDSTGSRLVLKGATGEAQAFTLTATETPGAEGLAALNIGVGASGTTIGSAAQDAVVAIDGVSVRRPTNSINDVLTGVKLDLVGAAPGTSISIGTQAPTESLRQAVTDFVATYNALFASLKDAVNPIDGPLRQDAAARTMLRSLSALSMKQLVSGAAEGSPDTLSGIGIATSRDGTLRVDSQRLSTALTSYGANVEAMFRAGNGLSVALSDISIAAANRTYGLGASEERYAKAQGKLADDQDKAAVQAEQLRTRMTRQFAGMDAVVSRYKATQGFLEQQVSAWNARD